MSRPDAFVNRIADALKRQIETHAATYPDLWREIPQRVKRGVALEDERGARPAICISSDGASEVLDHGAKGLHRELQPFELILICADGAEQEERIHDLVADVKRALGWSWQLRADDGPEVEPVLLTGRLILVSVETVVGPTESGSMLGGASIKLKAEYQWTDAAP